MGGNESTLNTEARGNDLDEDGVDYKREALQGFKIIFDLNSSSDRFLLELLQNADDNTYLDNNVPTLTLTFNTHLLLHCNEKGFSEEDRDAICRIGNSTKVDSDKTTGEKGIGFKTVFRVADTVWITSGGYNFKLRKSNPFAREDLRPPLPGGMRADKGGTYMYFEISGECHADVRKALTDFDPLNMLMLRKVRRLNISGTGMPERQIERREEHIDDRTSHVRILENGKPVGCYVMFTFPVELTNRRTRNREIARSEIILAIPVTSDFARIEARKEKVYARLPVNDFGFKFAIHADFELTASREEIHHDSAWNKELRSKVCEKFVEAVTLLSKQGSEYQYDWPLLLDMPLVASHFFACVPQDIAEELKDSCILKTETGQCNSAKNLVRVPDKYRIEPDFEPAIPAQYHQTRFRYLSHRYSSECCKLLELLEISDMAPKRFFSDLGSIQKDFDQLDADWHSGLARLILNNEELKPWLFMVRIIPVEDAVKRWIRRSEVNRNVFMSTDPQASDWLPKGIGLYLIPIAAHQDPDRRKLFTMLGATDLSTAHDNIAKKLREAHGPIDGELRRPRRLTTEHLISHIKFLFKNQETCKPPATFWVATKAGEPRLASETFGEPLSLRSCQPNVPYLHGDYFQGLSGPEKNKLLDWMKSTFKILRTPRLVMPSGDSYVLSSEMECIIENCDSGEVLEILKQCWPDYSPWLTKKSRAYDRRIWHQIASISIRCQDSRNHALRTTILPFASLIRLSDVVLLPLLPIPSNHRDEWSFLSELGVVMEPNLHEWIAYLRELKSLYPQGYAGPKLGSAISLASMLYGEIRWSCRDDNTKFSEISHQFEAEGLILVTEAKSIVWTQPSRCILHNTHDIVLQHIFSLWPMYSNTDFFVDVLEVPRTCDLTKLRYEAEQLNVTQLDKTDDALEYVRRLIGTIAKEMSVHKISRGDAAYFAFGALVRCQMLPIRLPKSTNHFDKLVSAAMDEEWFIADREHLLELFDTDVPLLALSVPEVESAGQLLDFLGLGGRRLSRIAAARPTDGTNITEITDYAAQLMAKAEYIDRLVPPPLRPSVDPMRQMKICAYSSKVVSVRWFVPGRDRRLHWGKSNSRIAVAAYYDGILSLYVQRGLEQSEETFVALARDISVLFRISGGRELLVRFVLSEDRGSIIKTLNLWAIPDLIGWPLGDQGEATTEMMVFAEPSKLGEERSIESSSLASPGESSATEISDSSRDDWLKENGEIGSGESVGVQRPVSPTMEVPDPRLSSEASPLPGGNTVSQAPTKFDQAVRPKSSPNAPKIESSGGETAKSEPWEAPKNPTPCPSPRIIPLPTSTLAVEQRNEEERDSNDYVSEGPPSKNPQKAPWKLNWTKRRDKWLEMLGWAGDNVMTEQEMETLEEVFPSETLLQVSKGKPANLSPAQRLQRSTVAELLLHAPLPIPQMAQQIKGTPLTPDSPRPGAQLRQPGLGPRAAQRTKMHPGATSTVTGDSKLQHDGESVNSRLNGTPVRLAEEEYDALRKQFVVDQFSGNIEASTLFQLNLQTNVFYVARPEDLPVLHSGSGEDSATIAVLESRLRIPRDPKLERSVYALVPMVAGTYDKEADFLGQIWVSQLFSSHLGHAYKPQNHWRSPFCLKVWPGVRLTLGEMPFEFHDETGSRALTEFLRQRSSVTGEMVKGWLGSRGSPIYYVDVATTVEPHETPIELPADRFHKARQYRIRREKKTPNYVFIFIRISNINAMGGPPRVAFYIDPWQFYTDERIDVIHTRDRHSVCFKGQPHFWANYHEPKVYKWRRLDGPATIRLLELKRGSGSGKLVGSLVDRDLNAVGPPSLPEYTAISYAWGSALKQFSLHIEGSEDGGNIQLPVSLYLALCRLRRPNMSILLWADAICIDQNSPAEKESQIQLMSKIFRTARTVFAWLGEDDDESVDAIRLLRRLGRAVLDYRRSATQTWENVDTSINRLTAEDLPHMADRRWAGVRALLGRPWFTRIWTVQEGILAAELIVGCGGEKILWEELHAAAALCFMNGMFHQSITTVIADETTQKNIYQLGNLRALARDEGRFHEPDDMFRLLQLFHQKKVTQPRDRLFALLGLATDGALEDFRPDYKASEEKIIYRYAAAFVRQGYALDLLYQARLAWKRPDLPSWAPQLTASAYPKTVAEWGKNFTAGGGGGDQQQQQQQQQPNRGELASKGRAKVSKRVLSLYGYKVDQVQSLGQIPSNTANILLYVQEIFDTIEATYQIQSSSPKQRVRGIAEAKKKALHRLAVGEPSKGPWDLAADEDPESAYTALREYLKYRHSDGGGDDWVSEKKIVLEATYGDNVLSQENHLRRRMWPYLSTAMKFAEVFKPASAVVCQTKKNRVGIVPQTACSKPGDEIVVFLGAKVPHLLRPVSYSNGSGAYGDGGGLYRVVGECYIEGIMHGELFKSDADPSEVQLQEFRLE